MCTLRVNRVLCHTIHEIVTIFRLTIFGTVEMICIYCKSTELNTRTHFAIILSN